MTHVQVLVVDDSVVMRQLLRQTFSADPIIRVQGVAANGRIALAMIAQTPPDAVVLDIEMPEMDGLTCVQEIRRRYPKLPVIMCSTLTEHGAAITLEALARGANDYVTKPSSLDATDNPIEKLRRELIPRIRALCRVAQQESLPTVAKRIHAIRREWPVRIVAIGASTGGPNALAEVLPTIPKNFPVPILIVQHMPPVFTRLMAERLDKTCNIRVQEAREGARLRPGEAWVAAGDFHLGVMDVMGERVLHVSQGPAENSCRPAVDVLFRSVAQVYGAGVLGVVLTGMGYDGLRGSEHVREAGGRVIVQDEATSVVWGMPRAVAGAGLADEIWPLSAMGAAIASAVEWKREAAVWGL